MQPEIIHHYDGIFYLSSRNKNLQKVHCIENRVIDGNMSWVFSDYYPDGLISLKDVKKIIPDILADNNALKKIEYLKSVDQNISTLKTLNSIDYDFRFKPMVHQMTAIEYMFYFQRLVLLLDMGLGKTFVSLIHSQLMPIFTGKPYKVLVLGPKIVLRNWLEETLKFTDLKPVLYRGTIKQRSKIRDRIAAEQWDIIITNYESVVKKGDWSDHKLFKNTEFDAVIMDEGSRLRGYKAQRTKDVYEVTRNIKRRYILSGALSLGKPDHLFQPFKILHHPILGDNYFKFKKKYCIVSKFNDHIITGYRHMDILKNRVSRYVLIQHRDDCIDLPDRTFKKVYYDLGSDQKKIYNSIVNDPFISLGDKEINTELSVVKITKLSQVISGFIILPYPRNHEKCNQPCKYLFSCIKNNIYPWERRCPLYDPSNLISRPKTEYYEFKANPKLSALMEIIEDSGDERIIIWARYRKEIDHIRQALDAKNIKYITSYEEDSDVEFRKDPTLKIYLGQVSQGIGTTLNDAKLMIYYSNSLDLEHRLQSLERNYRIGQTEKVVVIDLMCPGTIEASILNLIDSKTDMKEYFHKNGECNSCVKWEFCIARSIMPYSNECILSDVRKQVEKKTKIKIKKLKGDENA